MYCSNCGKIMVDNSNFCRRCGKNTDEGKKNNTVAMECSATLIKSVKNAGNSVFTIGILGLIIAIGLDLFNYFQNAMDSSTLLLVIPLDALIYALLIYWGNNLRNDQLEDLAKTKKLINITIIYTLIIIVIGFIIQSYPGLLTIIMLFDLFKARKQVNENIY